ncbi:PREDICTED: putative tRNA pseudouridine synthase Pus10 isoform X1 [Cercocebus atys]|uniref:putative tRNA pseudouridine synthase Pus10 isoform X1 n=1 Tax=Cercocebus atys TaxID=9531 RepID=UPI0005F39A29|nr:PREDICTED: putative tRNA pseudouridine synthase Pus10 isoform X1 [Cercocebus atys]XP_011894896.1 PREDICTED: putative tRNA pseudouridine synthase Pus10 isoform X1 [Cercocebus atys]XP_011894897.1 PREDICTED: putative tRNA pseudouridine synthase Pus10 isoform X1 [Cercocebus atys]XP_011894898.1 PREDICTED: putative tRNA pseudouridine synthase Pus10 isoform X1 [Cercocebus atys]XP_011894899.1 PREDICTED: putative tRNA pseudouridine synthase Pus10 isoform X1 [Cercocebus atys]XP_011894900.1 PREDICTED:
MFPLTEENKHVAQLLLSTGTCPRCIFRFCGVDFHAPYKLPYKELLNELQKFLETEKDELILEVMNPPPKKIRLQELEDSIDNLSQNGEGRISVSQDGSIASKNSNLNVCNVCLGILQEFCEKDFVKKVCQKVEASGFEFTSLVFSVSFPPQLSVREHAAWLLVKQEMGKQSLSLGRDDIVQLKEAYKWITHPLFSEELGVPIDGKSLFEVSVVFAHPETVEDCHFLAAICPDCFKPAKNKQSVFTRMAVMKALNKIKEEDFLKQFPCPPNSPKAVCTVLEIECAHGAVFVAGCLIVSFSGRYNKYSRNLPQTPWIIDGERKLESSVEELISDHLLAVFKAESFNFSSSGREDVDVRTLGNGRPFAIELVNPHRVHFTSQEIKELQQKINNSSNKIQVRDLQLVTREAIGHMKEGEEEKTKTYSALIWTDKAIQKKDIEFLNDIKDLKIDQKTPLRVLHRRPLAVRARVIHSMETQYVDEHHFRLRLKTQAGTYIKEFVHGDFGRTKPNIGSLMNVTADILELDVEVNHLLWNAHWQSEFNQSYALWH